MSTSKQKLPETPARTDQDLFKVMTWATAFSLGCLGAFLASVDSSHHIAFKFGLGTFVGFATGWAVGWGLWRLVQRLSARDRR